jgi:RNA recognition motif. (a.k.a. RRM, RBD, or RNP domain)
VRDESPLSGEQAVPMFKIYVGNLDPRVKIEQVREIFSPFMTIEDAVLVSDDKTGKLKGFAIVMVRDPEIGRAAVKATQGKRLLGKTLTINEVMKKGQAAAKAAKETRQGPFGPHFNRQGGGVGGRGGGGGFRRGLNRGPRGGGFSGGVGPRAGGAAGSGGGSGYGSGGGAPRSFDSRSPGSSPRPPYGSSRGASSGPGSSPGQPLGPDSRQGFRAPSPRSDDDRSDDRRDRGPASGGPSAGGPRTP